MVMGRPTKYDPALCEKVIELGKEGYSKAQICARIDICCDTLSRWVKEYPDFSEAIKKANYFAQSWWEDKARQGLFTEKDGPFFNSTLWYMNMKNRFGWRDKQDIEIDDQRKKAKEMPLADLIAIATKDDD